jgi:hypothetical protein
LSPAVGQVHPSLGCCSGEERVRQGIAKATHVFDFGGLGGLAGMRVQVLEREVAANESELVGQESLEFPHAG